MLVERYRVTETHSNACQVWKGMGSPQQPTNWQSAALKAAGQLQMLTSPEWTYVRDSRDVVT